MSRLRPRFRRSTTPAVALTPEEMAERERLWHAARREGARRAVARLEATGNPAALAAARERLAALEAQAEPEAAA